MTNNWVSSWPWLPQGGRFRFAKFIWLFLLLFWMIRMQWTLFFQVFCSSMDTMDKACKCKFKQRRLAQFVLGWGRSKRGPNELKSLNISKDFWQLKTFVLLFLRANLWSFVHIKPRICCQQLNTTAQQAAGLNKGWGQQDLKLQFSKSLGMCRLLGSPKLWTSFERGEIWEHYTAPCTQLTKMSGVEVSFSAPTYVPWA